MSKKQADDDYFVRLEAEKIAKLKAKEEAEAEAQAKVERKELHHHKCGKCGGDMNTVTFRGVEIEVCPDCGAVLLDNGELETLAGQDNSGVLSDFFGSIFGSRS